MLSRSTLLFAASSLLTACLSESDSEGSNYFVDDFQGVANLPYPIGMCSATSLTTYGIYSCSDDGLTVTKTTYSDATCTTSAGDAVEYTSGNATAAGLYEFNCDGMDDYASVVLCLSANEVSEGVFDCDVCSFRVESFQATDVCFNGGEAASNLFVNIECDADSLDATYYAPTCSNNETLATVYNYNEAGAECTQFTTLEISGTEFTLYWTYSGCSGYNSSDTSDSMPSTSSSDADGDSNNEDLAVRLSMTHSVFALQALVMVVPLIKLFV